MCLNSQTNAKFLCHFRVPASLLIRQSFKPKLLLAECHTLCLVENKPDLTTTCALKGLTQVKHNLKQDIYQRNRKTVHCNTWLNTTWLRWKNSNYATSPGMFGHFMEIMTAEARIGTSEKTEVGWLEQSSRKTDECNT